MSNETKYNLIIYVLPVSKKETDADILRYTHVDSYTQTEAGILITVDSTKIVFVPMHRILRICSETIYIVRTL